MQMTPGCFSSPNFECHCLYGFMMSNLISNILLFCFFTTSVHAFTPGSLLGHCGGADENYVHPSFTFHPLVSDNADTRAFTLTRPSQENFQVLMTDGGLHSSFICPLKKPSFFFDDALASDDELLAAENEQWIYEADGEWFFLPPIRRSHGLGYLHRLSVPHHMDWELVALFVAFQCAVMWT